MVEINNKILNEYIKGWKRDTKKGENPAWILHRVAQSFGMDYYIGYFHAFQAVYDKFMEAKDAGVDLNPILFAHNPFTYIELFKGYMLRDIEEKYGKDVKNKIEVALTK